MNPLEKLNEMVMGINTTKEVVDLWLEIEFTKAIIAHMMGYNPTMFPEERREKIFHESRELAMKNIQKRFPKANITFKETTKDETHDASH